VVRYGAGDLWYSFGTLTRARSRRTTTPGSCSSCAAKTGWWWTLAAIDILRSRERGVPRYNEFRRLLRLSKARSF
jgi:hypothetical protein